MNKFSEQKKQQVQTILKFLENSQISNPSHDSTKTPFFRGSPTTDPFLMDNKDLPKFPDTLNRHIKVLYEIIGNPDVEVYIGEWTILSLNKALKLYEGFCKDGQVAVFDVGFQYYGLGHIRVLACDLENHLLFYRPDGGSNGWDREANYKKLINYDKNEYEYMYFTEWMSSATNSEMQSIY